MLKDIIIKEKDSSVSYKDIYDLLQESHKQNIEKGFTISTVNLTPDLIEQRIGEKGKTFCAMHKDRVVGTASIRFVERHKWYADGYIPEYTLVAVSPKYQGLKINSNLFNQVFNYLNSKNYKFIELETAEKNIHAIDVYKHQGFKFVDFKAYSGSDHYTVVMVKWFEKPKHSPTYIALRYLISKILIKLRYKPGRKKRFLP